MRSGWTHVRCSTREGSSIPSGWQGGFRQELEIGDEPLLDPVPRQPALLQTDLYRGGRDEVF